jgi:hypothetical protein
MLIQEKKDGVHLQTSGSADFVEGMYIIIKKAALENKISTEGLDSLSELVTELSNRLKEEQESGEQEG